MYTLPDGFTFRAATHDDLEILLDLFNQYWKEMTGVVKFTLDDFKTIFSAPGFDLKSSVGIVISPRGEHVAAILVMDVGNPPIHPSVYGCVREGYEGRGIGRYIFGWAENRARKAIDRCPENARVSLHIQTAPSHTATVRLFERLSLDPIRYSWFMMKDLEQAEPEPVWPDRIQLQTQADFTDLESILKAADEAFVDHWGHVDRSGDPERMERFIHSIENDPDHDPSLWFLAMENDEIAGMALCSSRLGADRETGMVETLGVRRPWRRKGLGRALLHHAFRVFQDRGYKRAGLGVDSQNLSGATRLYKKVGMDVAREFVVYEKELRAGEELSKQS